MKSLLAIVFGIAALIMVTIVTAPESAEYEYICYLNGEIVARWPAAINTNPREIGNGWFKTSRATFQADGCLQEKIIGD